MDLFTGNLSGSIYSANCGWISLSNATTLVRTDTIQKGALAPDGLPIAWLLQNFGITNVNADADGNEYRPAESSVTYHVQASSNLITWTDIATYSGTNRVLTAQAAEISHSGSPNETVTLRDTTGVNGQTGRFLRVSVTTP